MIDPSAEWAVLYGIFALRLGFISDESLVLALGVWGDDKSQPLARILLARGSIKDFEDSLLEAVVKNHVERNGGNPSASLGALMASPELQMVVGRIGEIGLTTCLSGVGATQTEEDPYPTRLPTAEAAGSKRDARPTSGTRFTVLGPHAKGGLGAVFLARDEELSREVALKEIQEHHADDEFSRARFVLEAEVTGSLEHPGVVPVYGMGRYDDGRPYYVMRFIRGHTLEQVIRQHHRAGADAGGMAGRALAFRGLIGRLIAVCNAIEYAHSRGILHRDIKPSNIMIGDYGETLVVDWGLAKLLHLAGDDAAGVGAPFMPTPSSEVVETMAGSTVGTPHYMSPEQASGRLDLLSPASDVYGIGATFYFMLTGRNPFGRRRLVDLMEKVREGEFVAPRHLDRSIPRPLESICLKAMAKDINDRYRSAREMAEELEKWLGYEEVSAHRESQIERTMRVFRKNPGRAAWPFALIVCNMAALPIWLTYSILYYKFGAIYKDFGIGGRNGMIEPPRLVPAEYEVPFLMEILPAIAVFEVALLPTQIGSFLGYVTGLAVRRFTRSREKRMWVFPAIGLILGAAYGLVSAYDSWNFIMSFFRLLVKLSG